MENKLSKKKFWKQVYIQLLYTTRVNIAMVHVGLKTRYGKYLLKKIITGFELDINIFSKKYGIQHMQEIEFVTRYNINYSNYELYYQSIVYLLKEYFKNSDKQIVIEI